jgi:hypothetical protein
MNKPKSKAEWISAAKKLNVVVDKPDTVKEIKKNIADKLGVSTRGRNYENRLLVAMEKSLPKVSPRSKKAHALVSVKPGNVKLKFSKILHERELDVCFKFKKSKEEIWLPKSHIEMVSVTEVVMPDWLADLKKIS